MSPGRFSGTDQELVEAFEGGDLPSASFGHVDHVRVAWCLLQSTPLLEAAGRLTAGIQAIADANDAADLYHATLTWAFLFVIHDRSVRMPEGTTWEEFAAANDDLLQWPSPVIESYYTQETLASDLARRTFLMPDRALPA